MRGRVQVLPERSSRGDSNTYAKKQSALELVTATWAAENGQLHILEYLVERKYDEYDECACAYAAEERPLRLFEVLTRNRQSALGLSGRTKSAREQTHRMCTIPPRQQLSITIWLAIRTRQVTQFINTHKYTRKAFNNTDKNTERET